MKKSILIQQIISVFFVLFALVNGAHFASVLFLIAAFLMMPIKVIRSYFGEKGLTTAAMVSFAVIFFFAGVIFSPVQSETPPKTEVEEQEKFATEDLKTLETIALEDNETFGGNQSFEGIVSPKTEGMASETRPSAIGNDATDQPGNSAQGSSSLNDQDPSSDFGSVGQAAPVTLSEIPAYSDSPFVILRDNIPYFRSEELSTVGYESYAELDSFGRCGVALASCGREIMPGEGEERGSISSIKPTGWVQAQYDIVSGKYLYNRAHLLGWQLSAENANRKNLITGTRYFNVEGMLPFENMVADYIRETGNHVAYRVTPMFEGTDLLAKGVRMEAYSVEDQGEGICFHVFVYNVQPGIVINYASGSSSLEISTLPESTPTVPSSTVQSSSVTTSSSFEALVYRTPTGKRYHTDVDCGGKNSAAITRSEAEALGLTPCGTCLK